MVLTVPIIGKMAKQSELNLASEIMKTVSNFLSNLMKSLKEEEIAFPFQSSLKAEEVKYSEH